jgi:hypothetical protein
MSLADVMAQMMAEKKKRDQRKKEGGDTDFDRIEEKKRKRAERKEEEKLELQRQAVDSYLKIEQFQDINEGVKLFKKRLQQQQDVVDLLERKLLDSITGGRDNKAIDMDSDLSVHS